MGINSTNSNYVLYLIELMNNKMSGHSIEKIVAGAFHLLFNEKSIPITLTDLERITKVPSKDIMLGAKAIERV